MSSHGLDLSSNCMMPHLIGVTVPACHHLFRAPSSRNGRIINQCTVIGHMKAEGHLGDPVVEDVLGLRSSPDLVVTNMSRSPEPPRCDEEVRANPTLANRNFWRPPSKTSRDRNQRDLSTLTPSIIAAGQLILDKTVKNNKEISATHFPDS